MSFPRWTCCRRVHALVLSIFAALLMPVSHAATVMVTGANSGLGLELARQYAKAGWTVIAVHRHDHVPQTLADLGKQYRNVRAERMDITNEAEVHALAQRLKGVPIDVLINNAADTRIGETQRFGELDYQRGRQVLETNILGPLLVSEAFLPQIEAGTPAVPSSSGSLHRSMAGGVRRPGNGSGSNC